MAQDNKVVSLKGGGPIGRFTLPAPLVRLRDQSGQSLKKVLSGFFDRADDALFDMADRAGSNQDQTAYFDAMRELRLRRKNMVVSVLQHVSRAFNDVGRFSPGHSGSVLEGIDEDSLSLVDHSELEQRVAIENLVTKLRNHNGDSIRLLTLRVASLLPSIRLTDSQMPLSPEVICGGVAEACGDLDIDIRAKLVVLKLFDKLLVDVLGNFYQEANRVLIAEGVAPDMKRPPVKGRPVPPSSGSHPAPPSPDYSGYAARMSAHHPTFTELSELLHHSGGPSGYAGDHGGNYAGHGQVTLDTGSLMARLSDIQTSARHWEEGRIVPLSEQLEPVFSPSGGKPYSVGQVDGDVINLVSMLFEFILEDRQLHPTMKALIGRLQIPVLKVALSDKNFFNRGGHPVRKLLNELAMSAIGWSEKRPGQRDPLRDKIEEVVDRVIAEYNDNLSIFEELLADFTHFSDLDRRRRELVEQRLRDAEEGRARQEKAAAAADDLLNGLMEGRELSEPMVRMLEDAWRKYLQWVVLRKGDDVEEWQGASDLTRSLIWSVDPGSPDENTRSELLREIPGIVDGVRSALQEISWDPFATDTIVRDLEVAHVDVFQRLVAYREQPSQPTEAPAAPETEARSTAPAEPDRPSVEAPVAEEPQQEQPRYEAPASTAPAPDTAPRAAEPPVGKTVEATVEATVEGPAPSAEWLAKADNLRVGSWVEWSREAGKIRCKLAAFIKATGKYIFVNRSGAKVAEFHREDLAVAMSSEALTILDDGLIFDRALESIIDNLRHNRKD